jgi:isoleucyl-tRNA synthetase
MKAVAAAINTLEQTAINTLEEKGHLDLSIKGRLETIRAEEVEVSTDDIPGMLVLSQNGFTVALDITLTDSLRQEGLMRELVNRLQNLRKDQGLEVTDRISLHLEENPALKNAVQAQEAYLKTEVLATDMQWHPRLQAGTTLDIEGHNTRVQIVKQA